MENYPERKSDNPWDSNHSTVLVSLSKLRARWVALALSCITLFNSPAVILLYVYHGSWKHSATSTMLSYADDAQETSLLQQYFIQQLLPLQLLVAMVWYHGTAETCYFNPNQLLHWVSLIIRLEGRLPKFTFTKISQLVNGATCRNVQEADYPAVYVNEVHKQKCSFSIQFKLFMSS